MVRGGNGYAVYFGVGRPLFLVLVSRVIPFRPAVVVHHPNPNRPTAAVKPAGVLLGGAGGGSFLRTTECPKVGYCAQKALRRSSFRRLVFVEDRISNGLDHTTPTVPKGAVPAR